MCYRLVKNGDSYSYRLRVKVKPSAAHDAILGVQDQELVVAIAAPPLEGAVNRRLLKFLAKSCQVPPSQISLVRGARSRHKELQLALRSQLAWLNRLKRL